jgi:hypothetical protein
LATLAWREAEGRKESEKRRKEERSGLLTFVEADRVVCLQECGALVIISLPETIRIEQRKHCLVIQQNIYYFYVANCATKLLYRVFKRFSEIVFN